MNEAPNWSVITFLGYTAAVFLLAIFSHRLLKGRRFLSEYFLGSRSLGVWALALTYAATSASGGTFTGFPALIYQHGWILALWISSYMLVPVTCMALLGKRLNQVARKTGAITLPDVLRDRFRAPGLGILVSVTLTFFLTANLVAQFKAGGVILQVLLADHGLFARASDAVAWLPSVLYFGDPARAPTPAYCLALLLFASGVIIYTAYGGFRAVVWTDVLQGMVMFLGVLILLPLAIHKAGGMGKATRALARTPVVRVGQIVVRRRDPGPAERITIPDGLPLSIRRGPSRYQFRTAGQVALDGAAGRSTAIVVHAVPRQTLPNEAWAGTGADVRIDRGRLPDTVEIVGYRVGPRRNLVSGPGPSGRDVDGFLPFGLAVSFFVMWAIAGAGQPGSLVRLMAFKNTQVYRRAIVAVTFYFSLIYLPLVMIFVCARTVLGPALDEPDQVMARMVTAVAPPMLAGILLAAPFAAIMSTVDSFLLMISSSLVRDIYQRSINPNVSPGGIRRLSYATTVLIGVVVTVGALNPPKFLQDLIVFTTGGMACCYLAPMVLALYWKRATAVGVAASIVGGFLTLLGLYGLSWVWTGSPTSFNLLGIFPIGWGLIVSFVAGIVGSLASPPPAADLVRFYFAAAEKKND